MGVFCAVVLVCTAWAQGPQRIPRQQRPQRAAVQALVHEPGGRAVPAVVVELRRVDVSERHSATTNADGIVRFPDLKPGRYVLAVSLAKVPLYQSVEFDLRAGEVAPLAITLERALPQPPPEPWRGVGERPSLPESEAGPYRELPRAETLPQPTPEPPLPPAGSVFVNRSDRWNIPEPETRRYPKPGEFPYRKGRWWNPFDRNRWKGDYPVIGQRTFFSFTGISETVVDGRRLPVANPASGASPGTPEFFGRGGQFFLTQNFRFTFDLFHGDTAYRPVDWRIRVTPAANVNYLHAQETGIVNIDVRKGTNRTDGFAALQEAFVEYKVADLGPNYDFLSVRAGIQQFTSDFRGFLFVEEQPGIRIFGNLRSNRLEYNLAYFYFLEKDTNSLLNELNRRDQQVWIANLYVQDFVWKGYTTQFSFHYNKDDGRLQYDDNGFIVRPAPIGTVGSRNVRAYYLGWTGNGHIGRINVSHAFYQALGHETLNLLAGQPVDINAQLAALELSYDKDWARFKVSGLFASGDGDPRDGTARGFDTIVDQPAFAGGVFSLWNRQSIRVTGTGVQLVGPDSFLPNLRSNKFQGKANFVNPGLMLLNLGTEAEVTPKLRAQLNVNFMRFHRTAPLELLLFQQPIRAGIGVDYSLGLQYRPLLSENIVITGGVSALSPFQGFRDIYSDTHLVSLFSNLRFKF